MEDNSKVPQSGNMDKVKRYGWITTDKPGELRYINKFLLCVDAIYQRNSSPTRIQKLASEWSWAACGALIVAYRKGDGRYFVIDGGHRTIAASKRSDIKDLPCVVFEMKSIQEEARGFVISNSNRKPMDSIDKHRASLVYKDPLSIYIQKVFDELGISAKGSVGHTPKGLKSIAACYDMARENRERFEKTMRVASELHSDTPITEMSIRGLFYLSKHMEGDIESKDFKNRLLLIGPNVVSRFIKEASAYYVRGGASVWAVGILNAVNKGLRNRYKLKISSID